ncbi:hypothetical protein [Hyphomicrobium sp.]|jgi:hypothetical protein|uniref:hypothetical protein n=1 Tax=Hyphomicrobium sp. TaxID=82 RepID=UPI003561B43F
MINVFRKAANAALDNKSKLGPPPEPHQSRIDLTKPIGKPDARRIPKSGRTEQLNSKVRGGFQAEFDEARAGMTRGAFLEALLALWKKEQGGDITPFGLSDSAHRVASLIADHLKTDDLGRVLEDALISRAKELGLTKRSSAR